MDTALIETKCYLCNSRARTSKNPRLGFTYYDCRQCGEHHLSNIFISRCESLFDNVTRQQMAALVTEWNLKGFPRLLITDRDPKVETYGKVIAMPFRRLFSTYPITKSEVYDRALKNLAHLANPETPDEPITFSGYTPLGVFFATGETLFDAINNMMYTINEMGNMGYLDLDICQLRTRDSQKNAYDVLLSVKIAQKGWEQIHKSMNIKLRAMLQVVVAMTNDPAYQDIFENGIRPAVEWENGSDRTAKALRLEYDPDNSRRDQILAEIRRSLCLIADVSGDPFDVYQEAGFAQALGVPVFWIRNRRAGTGRLNEEKNTRKIVGDDLVIYETPEDLRRKLRSLLETTIPAR